MATKAICDWCGTEEASDKWGDFRLPATWRTYSDDGDLCSACCDARCNFHYVITDVRAKAEREIDRLREKLIQDRRAARGERRSDYVG